MYMVWHVDKYKITFKLVINWINEILQHIVVSSGLARPSIIDARARYWAAARRSRNTDLEYMRSNHTTNHHISLMHARRLPRDPQHILL